MNLYIKCVSLVCITMQLDLCNPIVKICSIHKVIWQFIFNSTLIVIDMWLNTGLVHDIYLKIMEGPWLADQLWEAHVTFFLLHNKLLQVAIWLGLWIVSFSRVLTMWQTPVCWSMIYLCEVVAQGVRSFGSTLCTQTWYQSVYEESLSVLIKI